MSSRSKNKVAKDLEGSHPQELRREHRQFLVRSVDRNDVDLSAVIQLNRSLHKARAQILESCGELVLLDLGVGRLTLVNDELHVEKKRTQLPIPAASADRDDDEDKEDEYTLTPAQKDMCVDFLLRLKLRRKLLNRLSRRLNRTAQALDGSEVSAPPPPRYGDLRLHIDPEAVRAQSKRWERQALAHQRILEIANAKSPWDVVSPTPATTKSTDPPPSDLPAEVPSSRVPSSEDTKDGAPKDSDCRAASSAEDEHKPQARTLESTHQGATATSAAAVSGEANTNAPPESQIATKEETKPMESEGNLHVSASSLTGPLVTPTLSSEAVAKESSEETPHEAGNVALGRERVDGEPEQTAATTISPQQDDDSELTTLQYEYQVIREYEDAYDKVWDKESKTFQYVIAKHDVVPDYMSIKAGAGIGAQTRLLSEQERAQEHKRWQTALLTQIPHQPTFEELGLKNRVFCLEARRKRCLDEAAEEDEDHEAISVESDTKKRKRNNEKREKEEQNDKEADDNTTSDVNEFDKDDGNDDSSGFEDDEGIKEGDDAMDSREGDEGEEVFGEDNHADAKEDAAKKGEDKPESDIKKIKLEPRTKNETNEEEKSDQPIEKPKIMKPMSLAAVPSFYDQDLSRIRAVHDDLLASSILEHARRQMADATNEYNSAHILSNQLFDHRTRLQQNLAYFMARSKTELAKVNNDYVLQVAIAKQNWMKQKQEYDKKRCKQFLPSSWGRAAYGTTVTQNYQRRGGVHGVVGGCMADIVDGALLMLEGKLANKKFDDFVAPPPPHTNNQTGESLSQQHRQMEAQLKRQMNDITVKLQASEDERQRAWTKMMKTKAEMDPTPTIIPGTRLRLDATNYHRVPLPPLRNSTQQAVPQEFKAQYSVAAYTPPSMVGGSDSKYSVAKVRERISSDGTVRTVQEPKKTKDGLYMRPAGRTRKGMQWDAVRGIWVPEGSQ